MYMYFRVVCIIIIMCHRVQGYIQDYLVWGGGARIGGDIPLFPPLYDIWIDLHNNVMYTLL